MFTNRRVSIVLVFTESVVIPRRCIQNCDDRDAANWDKRLRWVVSDDNGSAPFVGRASPPENHDFIKFPGNCRSKVLGNQLR
jgi:hypothetical protein